MRGLIAVLLALLAARMARRALRSGAGQYAEIMAALWQTAGLLAAATANTAKTRSIESRLNILVPRIPVPQNAPATGAGGAGGGSDTSSGAGNSSYDMGGGTVISYNPGSSGNNGGNSGSTTSNQIGGASPHVHDMTHFHTSSGDLQNMVNATRDSHSALVVTVNQLRNSHGNLVGTVNNLAADHSQLINDHKNLIGALKNTNVLR